MGLQGKVQLFVCCSECREQTISRLIFTEPKEEKHNRNQPTRLPKLTNRKAGNPPETRPNPYTKRFPKEKLRKSPNEKCWIWPWEKKLLFKSGRGLKAQKMNVVWRLVWPSKLSETHRNEPLKNRLTRRQYNY